MFVLELYAGGAVFVYNERDFAQAKGIMRFHSCGAKKGGPVVHGAFFRQCSMRKSLAGAILAHGSLASSGIMEFNGCQGDEGTVVLSTV